MIYNLESSGSEEGSAEAEDQSRKPATSSTIIDRTGGELPALLASGIMFLRAVQLAAKDRRRAIVSSLVGIALLGVGLYQRRSVDNVPPTANESKHVSDEARAHREQADVLHQSETNPRGTPGEPDVDTRPDEGNVQFTTEQDEGAKRKPDLDHADEDDSRRPDQDDPVTDDDHVEVNLSEAAMADEASEATGPTPEQSYPAREGTDPEPHSEKAPNRLSQGPVADTGPDTEFNQEDTSRTELDDNQSVDEEVARDNTESPASESPDEEDHPDSNESDPAS